MSNICGDCHLCCEHYAIEFSKIKQETIDFAKTWGVMSETQDSFVIDIEEPCRHLTKDGCDDYENRPLTCKEFVCDKIGG